MYQLKYNSDGQIERYKARLAVTGYSQQEGLDYLETFYPMAKMVTVRSIMALASPCSSYVFQRDVHNAFLQGELLEDVYMQIPDGLANQGETRWFAN